MSTQNPQNALSGAYKELYIVEQLGETEESEVPIGNLYDDFSLSIDHNQVEIEPGSSEFTITFDTHKTVTADFTNFYTAPEEVLENLGLMDENGDYIFGVTHDAARLYVYDTSPEEVAGPQDAIDCIEMPQFQPRLTEEAYPSDEISFDFEASINGRPSKEDPAEVAVE